MCVCVSRACGMFRHPSMLQSALAGAGNPWGPRSRSIPLPPLCCAVQGCQTETCATAQSTQTYTTACVAQGTQTMASPCVAQCTRTTTTSFTTQASQTTTSPCVAQGTQTDDIPEVCAVVRCQLSAQHMPAGCVLLSRLLCKGPAAAWLEPTSSRAAGCRACRCAAPASSMTSACPSCSLLGRS